MLLRILLCLLSVLLLRMTTALMSATEFNQCDISEFRCPSKDGQGSLCLPMDRWCNGKDDCDNRVDEPRSCSICNRTYYARLGTTYRLSLVRPRLTGTTQMLPWHCWFNFTALGGHHGDRVLVGMEAFSVGQLHRSDNGSFCLGGQVVQRDGSSASVSSMAGGGSALGALSDAVGGDQLLDQMMSGAWCGEGWGQPITTSSGKWLQLLLTISDVVDLSRFRFDLTYRVLPAAAVSVASSNSSSVSSYYGDPVPGTLCSRNLHSCDQRTCVIQSPNFPGLYPRNVTCYYYIRQSWSPKNTTSLITLGQADPGRSISVRTSDAGEKERRIMNGRDCRSHAGDTLSVYNGATVDSPLLARLCGTGNMPHVVGSGGEMLVVFRSQPHDAPFNPAPLGASPGFRLTARVRFTPIISAQQLHHPCRMLVISAGSNSRRSQRQGIIRSPEMTLPANTSCRYEFTAREDQRVWITFLSYRLDTTSTNLHYGGPHQQLEDQTNCLTLIDGQEIVSRGCGSSAQPRLCPRALVHVNASTGIKPCRWQDGESYISRSPRFTIAQELGTGTVLTPWSFAVRYEFITVDRFSSLGIKYSNTEPPDSAEVQTYDSENYPQLNSELEARPPLCYQLLESSKGNGSVCSPRNALLYGRGGSRHLRCLYRFQAGKGEHTHLTINPFQSAGCARFNQTGCQACLSVDEVFWGGKVRRRSYHTCRTLSNNSPVVVQSAASSLELTFEVRDMNWSQDDDHFYFVAEYSFSPGIDPSCWESHQQSGKRGTLRIDPTDRCVRHSVPWHLQAPRGGYIVLVFPAGQAVVMQGKTTEECLTNNRLFVYSITDGKTQLYREVCLMPPGGDKTSLHLYSAGWTERNVLADGLLVVASLQGQQPSDEPPMTITWLAIFKDAPSSSSTTKTTTVSNAMGTGRHQFQSIVSNLTTTGGMTCRTACPAFAACLSPDLWCDDSSDCPDGLDEVHCVRLVFWPLWTGLVVIILALTAALVAVYLIHHYYQARRYRVQRPYSSGAKENNKKAKFGSVTVSLSRHYEKAGPGS